MNSNLNKCNLYWWGARLARRAWQCSECNSIEEVSQIFLSIWFGVKNVTTIRSEQLYIPVKIFGVVWKIMTITLDQSKLNKLFENK